MAYLLNLFLISSAVSISPHLYIIGSNVCHDALNVFLIHHSNAISNAYSYASSSSIIALIFSIFSSGTFKILVNKLHLLLKLNPHSRSSAIALLGVISIILMRIHVCNNYYNYQYNYIHVHVFCIVLSFMCVKAHTV